MAEQGFSVRLSARVDGYLAAMAEAKKATRDVGEGVDFERLGSKMTAVGSKMTGAVTLPLIGVGVAAVKMSSDFEDSFAKMVGLAGVSADEVDGLKESVLNLAGETGRAPQELADGLYFLRSSGLDAGKAMDALQVSAKASAAGLGSTEVIADAVSSAMNAYAKSGLTAAEATDTLVATARAGKAEPAQLAGALGRILPISSELGVSFKDVGGAIASLSLNGNDASESATLLTNILSKLLKPSQQGAQALADVGLSTDTIRASIKEKGLLGTLDDLKARLGDAGFVKFLEDAQAVQGALSLTGQNGEHVKDVFNQVADSVGATDEAFAAASQTSGFKMKQAWAEVQVALIKAGDIILPIIAGVADAVGHMAEAFSGLPHPVQVIVLALLGLVAAAGPLLVIGGKLVSSFNQIKTAMEGMGSAAGKASMALGIIGAAVTLGTILYGENQRAKQKLTDATNALADALQREKEGQQGAVREQIGSMITPDLISRAEKYGLSISDLADVIAGKAVPAFDTLKSSQQKPPWWDPFPNNKFDEDTTTFVNDVGLLTKAMDGAREKVAATKEVNDSLGLSTERTAEQVAAQTANFNEQLGLLPDEAGGLGDVAASSDEVTAAQEAAAAKAKVFSDALQTQIDKLLELYPKQYDAVQAKYDYRDSVAATWIKLNDLNTTLGDHKAKQEDVTSATNAARDAILDQAAKFATLDGAAIGSEGAIRRQIESLKAQRDALAPDSPLRAFLDEYISDLERIPSNISTILDLHISSGQVTTAAGDVIGKRGIPGADNRSAGGRFAYGGSMVRSTLGEVGGSLGDEVVLPIGNAASLRRWLGDPRVGPPIAAAMYGGGVSSGGGSVVNDNRQVVLNGGINNTSDERAFYQRANFLLASA